MEARHGLYSRLERVALARARWLPPRDTLVIHRWYVVDRMRRARRGGPLAARWVARVGVASARSGFWAWTWSCLGLGLGLVLVLGLGLDVVLGLVLGLGLVLDLVLVLGLGLGLVLGLDLGLVLGLVLGLDLVLGLGRVVHGLRAGGARPAGRGSFQR